jgi:hypothetical protein
MPSACRGACWSLLVACSLVVSPGRAEDPPAKETPAKGAERPRWTIQVDPLTMALGFMHVQVERALGEHVSVYLGPSVRLFDPLEEKPGSYWGAGAEAGLRVFPWGGAPRGGWVQVRGVLARLRTEDNGGDTAVGGYASVLGGHTWILSGRWVLAAGLGAQYLHYRVGGLGPVRVFPAAHTTLGVAFLERSGVGLQPGSPSRSACQSMWSRAKDSTKK